MLDGVSLDYSAGSNTLKMCRIMRNTHATNWHRVQCSMSLKSFLTDHLPAIQLNSDSLWSKLSYGASGGAAATGALTLNEVLMIIGTMLALATFAVNFYFQCKRNAMDRAREAREQELHEAKLAAVRATRSSR